MPKKRNGAAFGSVSSRRRRESLGECSAKTVATLVDPVGAALDAANCRGFVYLLALADVTAFHIGSCCDPLQHLRTFTSRFHERFDLSASVVMQARSFDEALALEARLKRALAHHRTQSPPWLSPTGGAHAEWFEASQFVSTQQHLLVAARSDSTSMISGARIVASHLVEQRPDIEAWAFHAAKQLNAHVAHAPGERQLQLARSLRDWWDLFLHLRVPWFAGKAEQSDFVCQMVRLYRPALAGRS